MKKMHLVPLCLCIIALTALLFAYNQQWIIFNLPVQQNVSRQLPQNTLTKKTIRLFFWHQEQWHHEDKEIIWSEDPVYTIEYIVKAVLTLLDEERILKKRATLQSVTIAHQEAYVSFDRVPFNKESSIYEKWMYIEGILRSLRENDITIQKIHFLVHHQPMYDVHLDFSHPWSLQGFCAV